MEDQKLNQNESAKNARDYESPAIEEVVSREGIEREVAYAGVINQSQLQN